MANMLLSNGAELSVSKFIAFISVIVLSPNSKGCVADQGTKE